MGILYALIVAKTIQIFFWNPIGAYIGARIYIYFQGWFDWFEWLTRMIYSFLYSCLKASLGLFGIQAPFAHAETAYAYYQANQLQMLFWFFLLLATLRSFGILKRKKDKKKKQSA
ncbi:MAG: hypothetical protein ABIA93_03410 [Candidatus Woesearchaeota archaeon]